MSTPRLLSLKPGFHMIATMAMITVIAAITEKKKVQRSYGNHFPAIVAIAATTVAEIEKVLSQRLLSLRLLESGFHMIAAIAKLFFSLRWQ